MPGGAGFWWTCRDPTADVEAVGVRRQAGRDADGRRAVDRVGWDVGAGRAAVAEAGAVASGWAQPPSRPTDAVGDLVRVAHRHRLAALAAGAGLRLGRNLLAAA